MRLHGEGVAGRAQAIAEGLKESLAVIADEQGIEPKEAMGLVALTQYMDTLRSVGENGNMTTLLLPHSPGIGGLADGPGAGGHADRRPGRRRGPPRRRGAPNRPDRARAERSGGMLEFLGARADPRLLHADPATAAPRRAAAAERPGGRGHDAAGDVRVHADRSDAAGRVRRSRCSAAWRLLFDAGASLDAVVGAMGALLVATHWGWVHVAEYAGETLDARRGGTPGARPAEPGSRRWSPIRA